MLLIGVMAMVDFSIAEKYNQSNIIMENILIRLSIGENKLIGNTTFSVLYLEFQSGELLQTDLLFWIENPHSIKTTTPYSSARLIIEMEQPTHHIMTSNPTTYRSAWDFYLVFKSPKFYNVFFEKRKWKPIEKK